MTYPHIIKKGMYNSFEDLYLSSGHAVLINNEFINCSKLNLEQDIQKNNIYVYYSIKTEDYYNDTLIANGVAIETWGGWKPYMKDFELKSEYFNESAVRYIKPFIQNTNKILVNE